MNEFQSKKSLQIKWEKKGISGKKKKKKKKDKR
jgi:hypothetical protein